MWKAFSKENEVKQGYVFVRVFLTDFYYEKNYRGVQIYLENVWYLFLFEIEKQFEN